MIIECPHCKEFIWIEQINCGIFRHGVLKTNMVQIHPHSPKALCDYYVLHDKIIGCGKPFQITLNENNEFIVSICDYI
jgi:hypothetical protein